MLFFLLRLFVTNDIMAEIHVWSFHKQSVKFVGTSQTFFIFTSFKQHGRKLEPEHGIEWKKVT